MSISPVPLVYRLRLLGVLVECACWSGLHDDAARDAEDWLLLDSDERMRWVAFPRERERRRFLRSHAGLRRRLGLWLGAAPQSLHFEIAAGGKPWLPAWPDVDFSLSHSAEWSALALVRSSTVRVGNDIEAVRQLDAPPALVRHALRRESTALAALPPACQAQGVLRAWTGKEAVLKALGTGLAGPMDAFCLKLDACGRPLGLDWDPSCEHSGEPFVRQRALPQDAARHGGAGNRITVRGLPEPPGLAAWSVAAVSGRW